MNTYDRHILTAILSVLFPLMTHAVPTNDEATTYRQAKIQVEQLPSLQVPRSGHATLYLNGELTVIGGHTSGFIPTPTAEYYKDGEWHLMQTVYAHDGGLTIPLSSGKALIAGGFEKHLGIGQTFVVEMYDPVQHSFTGFGCLDKKRVSASGIELDSSQVYITGNWYHDDDIERFDGVETFSPVKDVTEGRYRPYLLRIAPDDFLIFGCLDTIGQPLHSDIVDCLQGDTLHIPLLKEWQPLFFDFGHFSDDSFIGNIDKGIYAYLIPVKNDDGQVAIALVEGTRFSLLPTTSPIPMKSQWGDIRYYSPIIVDHHAKRGYMMGIDKDCRQYILAIEYNKRIDQGVPLTLYNTDPLPDVGSLPVLTPEGNIVMAGGVNWTTNNNYSPSSGVYLFHVSPTSAADNDQAPLWVWLQVVLLLLIISLTGLFIYTRRQQRQAKEKAEHLATVVDSNELLMQRICLVMEQQKLFLQSNLQLSDVANLLNTNKRYISDCIKATRGCTFNYFVNRYRIDYAKRLIQGQPDIKIAEVYYKSGFANETSFYRTFKTMTGMTPKEWLTKIDLHFLHC